MHTKFLPLTLIATSAAAVLLSACGGGSDSDDSPPTPKDSAACFNEGRYHAGTEVRLKGKQSGPLGISGTHSVSRYTDPDPAMPPMVGVNSGYMFHWDYYSLEPDALLEQKVGERYISRRFVPAVRHPITMQPGQTVEQTVQEITTNYLVPSNPTEHTSGDIYFSKTYVGRENIETALGKLETCKFITKHRTTTRATSPTFSERIDTEWVAASGPYRGFPVKAIITTERTDSPASTSESEVTEFTQFDIK